MKDICTYLLKLRGPVSDSEINSLSPIQVSVEQLDADGALLAFCTDQSGLVGLLRHLHGLGFIFLSLTRVEQVI